MKKITRFRVNCVFSIAHYTFKNLGFIPLYVLNEMNTYLFITLQFFQCEASMVQSLRNSLLIIWAQPLSCSAVCNSFIEPLHFNICK